MGGVRPLVKTAIKGYVYVSDALRESAAEAGEQLADLIEEVRAEARAADAGAHLTRRSAKHGLIATPAQEILMENGSSESRRSQESSPSTSQVGRCAMPVTLINVFSVPQGKEDEFVKWWQDVKASITKQPGFMSGSFIRASSQRANLISSMSRYGKTRSFTGKLTKRARLP